MGANPASAVGSVAEYFLQVERKGSKGFVPRAVTAVSNLQVHPPEDTKEYTFRSAKPRHARKRATITGTGSVSSNDASSVGFPVVP